VTRLHKHGEHLDLERPDDPWPILEAIERAVRRELAQLFPDREIFERVAVEDAGGSERFDDCRKAASAAAVNPHALESIQLRIGFNELLMAIDDLAVLVILSTSQRSFWLAAEGPVESVVRGVAQLMTDTARRAIAAQEPSTPASVGEPSTPASVGELSTPASVGEPATQTRSWRRIANNPWVYTTGATVIAGVVLAWITRH
jgi:hypothetical protein